MHIKVNLIVVSLLLSALFVVILTCQIPTSAGEEIDQPIITLESCDIIKGEPFALTGTLKDHTGKPISGEFIEIFIDTKPVVEENWEIIITEKPPVATAKTNLFGRFLSYHILPVNFSLGIGFGAARLYGSNLTANYSLIRSEVVTNNVEFNVSAHTNIVLNQTSLNYDFCRGRDFVVSGNIYETYQGELTSIMVKPQTDDPLKILARMKTINISDAPIYQVGETTLTSSKGFQLHGKAPANIEISEYIELILTINGNSLYKSSSNASTHKLYGSIFFDRAEILASFPEKDEGRPAIHEEKFNHRSRLYDEPWIISVPIYEDLQGRQPPPVTNATVYLNITGDYFVNSSVTITDSNGVATFRFITPLKDKDYPDRIKLLHREKEKYVLKVTITFVGNERLKTESTSFNMTYYPTPPPSSPISCGPEKTVHIEFFLILGIFILLTIIILIRMNKRCSRCGNKMRYFKYNRIYFCRMCHNFKWRF